MEWGESASLIASTLRSNQSLTAWLVAQSKGPHSVTPARIAGQRRCQTGPADTTPQQNAHMGGNQVMGLSSSSTTEAAGKSEVRAVEAGRDIGVPRGLLEMLAFSRGELSQSVAAQFRIQALPAETEYFRGRRPIVAGDFQRSLDAQLLDHVGRFAHQVLQGHASHELGQLRDRSRLIAIALAVERHSLSNVANRKAETGLLAVDDRYGIDFHVAARPILAAQLRREHPQRAVLAQLCGEQIEIHTGAAKPTIERLVARLLLGRQLGQVEESAIGVQNSSTQVG